MINNPHLIILTWKAPAETIDCLTNVFECGFPGKIVVVDNCSDDDTADYIKLWANTNNLRLIILTEDDIKEEPTLQQYYDIVLIKNARNHGFAGGNNRGINFSFSQPNCNAAWVLNNDARINSTTYEELAKKLESNTRLAFVGSVIRQYETPNRLQCFGGMVIHKTLGVRSLYKKNLDISRLDDCNEHDVDALMAASLLIRKDVVTALGLMCEEYFMYAEEVDWQIRAKAAGWEIGVAENSHIFHKGSHSMKDKRSLYFYYLNRSSVMLTKRFFPARVFIAVPALTFICLLKNWSRPKNLLAGIKGIVEGARFSWRSSNAI